MHYVFKIHIFMFYVFGRSGNRASAVLRRAGLLTFILSLVVFAQLK